MQLIVYLTLRFVKSVAALLCSNIYHGPLSFSWAFTCQCMKCHAILVIGLPESTCRSNLSIYRPWRYNCLFCGVLAVDGFLTAPGKWSLVMCAPVTALLSYVCPLHFLRRIHKCADMCFVVLLPLLFFLQASIRTNEKPAPCLSSVISRSFAYIFRLLFFPCVPGTHGEPVAEGCSVACACFSVLPSS